MTDAQTEARAIARYAIHYDARGEYEHPNGDFVHYADHVTAIAAKDAELAEMRRKLFPHADANPIVGFSYSGFYFISDEKGIKELRRLENNANQIETWRRSFDENLAAYKDRAERAEAQLAEAMRLLSRYRIETPLGNQPHMIAHEVDEFARCASTGGSDD